MRVEKVDPIPFLPTHKSRPGALKGLNNFVLYQVWSHSTGGQRIVARFLRYFFPFSPFPSTHFSLSLPHAFTPLFALLILRFRASPFTFTLPSPLLIRVPSSAQINRTSYPSTSSELTRHGAKPSFVFGPSCCQQSVHSSIETTKHLKQ